MPPEEQDPLVAASDEAGTGYEDYGYEDARPTTRRGSSVRFENINMNENGDNNEESVDYGYEDARPTERRRRSSVRFPPTLKKLDIDQPVRRSVVRRESFIVQFAKTKGPPQITFIMMLIAIGLGCVIGVVPAVMTDRFARLNHGYVDEADCSSYDVAGSEIEKPQACYMGSADAQTAVATSNLISNSLTFLTSSLIGSLSDEYGRRGILILGVVLSTFPPLTLFLIQLYPTMSPWVYYGCHALTGLVNWMAVALSSLADVLPQKFRAPGIGLLMAGFMLGFSLAPIFAFVFNQIQLCFVSLCVVFGGLLSTIFFVPETLQPQVAEEARRRRQDTATNNNEQPRLMQKIMKFLLRPLKEMSILNRNSFFRLISLLAFFSGMVTSGDQLLLVYYVEERLGFTAQDVSIMFLIMGMMGLMAQAFLLKPLNECVGEKMVVAICFFVGAVDNTMYGLAQNKATIYSAVALASITMMAFPTISAIKANNVDVTEQGRIQGALYSLQALASGVGPVLLRFIYGKFKETPLGPGAMFVFAGMLYLVAVAAACALPKELANSKRDDEDDTDESDEGDILDMTDHDESTEFDLNEESYGAVSEA